MSVEYCLELLAERCSQMARPVGVRGLRNRVMFCDKAGDDGKK